MKLHNSEKDNSFIRNSPYQSEEQNKPSCRGHKRLKTHPGANSNKDGLLPDDIIKPSKIILKPKDGHQKASTVPGQVKRRAQYHNMAMFKQLRETKQIAETAMKVSLAVFLVRMGSDLQGKLLLIILRIKRCLFVTDLIQ